MSKTEQSIRAAEHARIVREVVADACCWCDSPDDFDELMDAIRSALTKERDDCEERMERDDCRPRVDDRPELTASERQR